MDALYIISSLVLVLVVGILSHILANYLHVPKIIFLLAAGILLGPEALGLVDTSVFGSGFEVLVSVSVAIIVFEGALSLDLRDMKLLHSSIFRISSIGFLITFLTASFFTYLLTDFPFERAMLFGALASATGPTVVTPLLRQIHANYRVSNLLSVESVVNDGLSVILAALIFEGILFPLSGVEAVLLLFARLVTALFLGGVSGLLLVRILNRIDFVTAQYARLMTITAVLSTFVAAELLSRESGIMTMAIMGIVVGSSQVHHKEVVREFKEDIALILLSLIFILLASMIRFENIKALGLGGVAVVLALLFIIRPFAVLVSTFRSNLSAGERLFVSLIAPRGIVPASMATYFLVRFREVGVEAAGFAGLVFLTIIITVVFAGSLGRYIAHRVGVVPMEILIVGSGEVGRVLAERLSKRGENVVVVDSSKENCELARRLGVRVVCGDGGNADVLKKAGIERAKYVVATTDHDDTNLLVCQIAKSRFGFEGERLVARVNDPKNLETFRDLGIRSISPVVAAAVMLDSMVGHPALFSMCEVSGEGEIVELTAKNPHVVGRFIKNIPLPKDAMIVMIQRGDEKQIAHPDSVIMKGDVLTVVGKTEAVRELAEMIE
jgi:NhaP-type Na+/H+ or K+/H+ antiporter